MKYLALLLLTGCATQSFDDLLLERAVCANSSENCDDLEKEVAKRAQIREWRRNAEMNCPKGPFSSVSPSVAAPFFVEAPSSLGVAWSAHVFTGVSQGLMSLVGERSSSTL